MKKLLIAITGCLLFIGCSETKTEEKVLKTQQQIAEENISSYLKKELNDPSSYQPEYFGKLTKIDADKEFNENLKEGSDSTFCLKIKADTEGCYRVEHKYRAKNGYGAIMKEELVFVLDSVLNIKMGL